MSYIIDTNALTAALKKCGSKRAALVELGFARNNSTALKKISALIIEHDLEHLLNFKSNSRAVDWSAENLQSKVSQSKTFTDVLFLLELQPRGHHINFLRNKLDTYQIDYSHFNRYSYHFKPAEDVFVKDRGIRHNIVKKKFMELVPYECLECKGTEWRGKPIRLELDHINGVSWDHRIENLRLLCPNCHSQTETYCLGSLDKLPK